MLRPGIFIAAAAAALALSGCQAGDPAPPAGTGPLGNDSGGGNCVSFHPGEVATYSGPPLTNTLHHPAARPAHG